MTKTLEPSEEMQEIKDALQDLKRHQNTMPDIPWLKVMGYIFPMLVVTVAFYGLVLRSDQKLLDHIETQQKDMVKIYSEIAEVKATGTTRSQANTSSIMVIESRLSGIEKNQLEIKLAVDKLSENVQKMSDAISRSK